MDCGQVEDRLTDYMDQSLASEEMTQIARHLNECVPCQELHESVRSLLLICSAYVRLEPEVELIDRILLRTSGRLRTRTLKELFQQYFLRPVLTPRFAVGVGLAMLFMAFTFNLMMPRVSSFVSIFSPHEMVLRMDRTVQQVYSGSLKLYDKKNEWQAQFTFYKNNVLNRLGFVIDELDVPVQGKEKPGERRQQQEKAPSEKSSLLVLPA